MTERFEEQLVAALCRDGRADIRDRVRIFVSFAIAIVEQLHDPACALARGHMDEPIRRNSTTPARGAPCRGCRTNIPLHTVH